MSRLRNSTVVAIIALPVALLVATVVGFRRLIADYNDDKWGDWDDLDPREGIHDITYDEWDIDDEDYVDLCATGDCDCSSRWADDSSAIDEVCNDFGYYDDSPEWTSD